MIRIMIQIVLWTLNGDLNYIMCWVHCSMPACLLTLDLHILDLLIDLMLDSGRKHCSHKKNVKLQFRKNPGGGSNQQPFECKPLKRSTLTPIRILFWYILIISVFLCVNTAVAHYCERTSNDQQDLSTNSPSCSLCRDIQSSSLSRASDMISTKKWRLLLCAPLDAQENTAPLSRLASVPPISLLRCLDYSGD